MLLEELVEEVLLRLPPEDPKHLVLASSVCKPWRRILADGGFRRRYREFHGAPPLLGFLRDVGCAYSQFVPTSSFRPAQPDRPRCWQAFDARHGRALFCIYDLSSSDIDDWDFGLAVWDPTTDEQHILPQPFFTVEDFQCYTAAVLCSVEGCDHRGCQGGPFHVVAVSTKNEITSARRYSSETGAWSEITSVYHSAACAPASNMPSVLVGGALYFAGMPNHVIECQLGSLRLSVFEAPPKPLCAHVGTLVTSEDGALGFASVDDTNLILWSRETGPEGWAQRYVIDLKTLLPDGALLSPALSRMTMLVADVCGFAEGTQVIFVGTYGYGSLYMVELKSRRVRKLVDVDHHTSRVYPYMSFYIPAMEAASTGQGQ